MRLSSSKAIIALIAILLMEAPALAGMSTGPAGVAAVVQSLSPMESQLIEVKGGGFWGPLISFFSGFGRKTVTGTPRANKMQPGRICINTQTGQGYPC
jgi:hypothetical protein